MNTALKWLVLASCTHVAASILGSLFGPPRIVATKFGGFLNGQVSLQDLLATSQMMLSFPLAVWLIQLGLTLLALRPGWPGRIGVGGLILEGAFFTITAVGTMIVLLLSAGGVDRVQTIAFWTSVPFTLAMVAFGISALRTKRNASPAPN